MIGQSIINIKSGGRGRLSGITAALALLFFILFGSSYIEQVPIAALVGVMFMVVLGTFAWSTFTHGDGPRTHRKRLPAQADSEIGSLLYDNMCIVASRFQLWLTRDPG